MNRFPQVKTLIVNNFKEAEDTPDHNRLQGMFLDECFCLKIGNMLITENKKREYFNEYLERFELVKNYAADYIEKYKLKDPNYKKEWDLEYSYICNLEPYDYVEPHIEDLGFERDGADVKFTYKLENNDLIHEMPNGESIMISDVSHDYFRNKKYYGESIIFCNWVKVEIKPSVGDDFPSIMRQMKSNECDVLFYSEYKGIGISEENMRKMMKLEHIDTIRLDEVK